MWAAGNGPTWVGMLLHSTDKGWTDFTGYHINAYSNPGWPTVTCRMLPVVEPRSATTCIWYGVQRPLELVEFLREMRHGAEPNMPLSH